LELKLFVIDIWRSLGWRALVLILLTLLVAITEGLTIAALLPLLAILGLGDGTADGIVVNLSSVALGSLGLPFTVGSVGFLLGVLIAISALLFLAQARLATRLQARYVAHWQSLLAKALVGARWSHLRGLPRGAFLSAITVEAPRMGAAFDKVNLAATSIMFILTQSIIALVVAPLGTIILLLLAGTLFVSTRVLSSRAKEDGRALARTNASLAGRIGEIANALKLVKATASESGALHRMQAGFADIERASARSSYDVQVARAVFQYGGGGAIVLLLVFGPLLGYSDIGSTLIVVALFVRLFPKITGLRQSLQSISVMLPSFEACRSIEESARLASEQTSQINYWTAPQSGKAAALALRNAKVALPNGTILLEGISLDIEPGSYVAFVGPSGAGKTTLIDLLMGLIEPSGGMLLVDGVPLDSTQLLAWRHRIGYLGQDPIAFTGTISENLSWVRHNIDRAQMRAALSAAAADDIRADLDASVGEGGSGLSGGERQRLALARALAGGPGLLVLDEATSALDAHAERRVVETLRALKGTVTILAVSHRLWSVKDADRVIVVDGGRVIQEGSYKTLAARPGWFRETLVHQDHDANRSVSEEQD
jgi:ATP-binding cassette subfamily C protein